MNEEDLEIEKGIRMPKGAFFALMIGMFLLGMLISTAASWLVPAPAQVISASSIKNMSIDEIDEYYNSKQVRVVGATVEKISNNGTFLITDVGKVFFKNDDDVFRVREGERFTFVGRLRIDYGNSVLFSQSEFINLYEEEEQ